MAGFAIAGLGNPGPRYHQSRHNVGFDCIDRLVGQVTWQQRFHSHYCQLNNPQRHVLKPQTFMNVSGRAIQSCHHFFKLSSQQWLIAHDDLDLAPGTIRLKYSGGHGGHNGLRDIIQQIGADFWRLRIGIGHPGSRHEVTPFVLTRPSQLDNQRINQAIDYALTCLNEAGWGHWAQAQQKLHQR